MRRSGIKQRVLAARIPLACSLYIMGAAAFCALPLASVDIQLDEKAISLGMSTPAARKSAWLEQAMSSQQQLAPASPPDLYALVAAAAVFFPTPAGPFTISRLPSLPPENCSSCHIVSQARRGSGVEALAIVLPVDPSDAELAPLVVSFGMASARHLEDMGWLAKDIITVFVDSRCGSPDGGVKAWLRAYHGRADPFHFRRAGGLQQAVVWHLLPGTPPPQPLRFGLPPAQLCLQGGWGRLPNLDMYWTVKRSWDIFSHGPPATVGCLPRLDPLEEWVTSLVGRVQGWLEPTRQRHSGAHSVHSRGGGSSSVAAQRYVDEVIHLVGFAARQAEGGGEAAGGVHGGFQEEGVDAVTVRLQVVRGQERASAAASMAVVEALVRALNGLQEHLHHGPPTYALVSPGRVVELGPCLVPPGLLLAALVLQLWAELDAAPPAQHPAWSSGCGWALALQGAAVTATAWAAGVAWSSPCWTRLVEGFLGGGLDSEGADTPSHPLPVGGPAWTLALAVLVSTWRWVGALQRALVEGGGSSVQQGQQEGRDSVHAVEKKLGSGGREGVRCLRVVTLGCMALVAAGLLLSNWALCYAVLLSALPCMLSSWQAPVSRQHRLKRQQGAETRRGQGRVGVVGRCTAVCAAPAVLLWCASHAGVSTGGDWVLTRVEPAAGLGASQVGLAALVGLFSAWMLP